MSDIKTAALSLAAPWGHLISLPFDNKADELFLYVQMNTSAFIKFNLFKGEE